MGLYLGPYGGPRGAAVSYERGTPVEPFNGSNVSQTQSQDAPATHHTIILHEYLAHKQTQPSRTLQ